MLSVDYVPPKFLFPKKYIYLKKKKEKLTCVSVDLL